MRYQRKGNKAGTSEANKENGNDNNEHHENRITDGNHCMTSPKPSPES